MINGVSKMTKLYKSRYYGVYLHIVHYKFNIPDIICHWEMFNHISQLAKSTLQWGGYLIWNQYYLYTSKSWEKPIRPKHWKTIRWDVCSVSLCFSFLSPHCIGFQHSATFHTRTIVHQISRNSGRNSDTSSMALAFSSFIFIVITSWILITKIRIDY